MAREELRSLPPRPTTKAKRRALAAEAVRRWAEIEPDPKCELYYETPYQLLISVVLSAQATDRMVNRCMEPLYRAGLSPQTVLDLGEAGLLAKIRTIGLAPTKAKNILALTGILVDRFAGHVPHQREELEALPGVGRKTANVILGEIFREPTLAVDTHVFRVGQRLGLHNALTPAKAEAQLLDCFAKTDLPAAHHWMILHGRYTCTAKNPKCDGCVVRDLCHASVAAR